MLKNSHCHSRAAGDRRARVAIVLFPLLAVPAVYAALPNLDGLWQGKGIIGLGSGTTFVFAAEAGDGGVEGFVGGYLSDAGGKCDDAAAAGRAAYAAPWGAVKLFTNAPASALLLKTTTRLTGVQYDEGAVSAAEWTSNATFRPATLTRLSKLPAGVAVAAANAYAGCAAAATPVPGGVAGAKGSTHDGAFAPLVPSVFDGLPALAARGGPPFLRGFFAAPAAAGAYASGGFAWAVLPSGAGGGGGLEATGGHFLSHTCPGPYSYRAIVARVTATVNGDARASAYCEAGELDPVTGVLKIWVGEPETAERPVCPRTRGAPTFTSVRVGDLTGAKAGHAGAPPCTAYGPADDGDHAGGKADAVEGGGAGAASSGVAGGAGGPSSGWLWRPLSAAALLLLLVAC